MLVGNYTVLSKNPGRDIGGGAIGLGMNRGEFNKGALARGAFTSATWDPLSGVPDGYRPPYSWVLPITAGGLSARNALIGNGELTGAIAGGLNAESSLVGTGSLVGVGALIVSLQAALSGAGALTGAAEAFLNLAASLAGAGDIDGALTAIGHAAAAVSGAGTLTLTLVATGAMAASITVTGDVLTTGNVASAVWDAIAEGVITYDQMLRIIAAATAGKSSGGPSDPVFRNLSDTQDQITGTADSNGDRSAVTYGA